LTELTPVILSDQRESKDQEAIPPFCISSEAQRSREILLLAKEQDFSTRAFHSTSSGQASRNTKGNALSCSSTCCTRSEWQEGHRHSQRV